MNKKLKKYLCACCKELLNKIVFEYDNNGKTISYFQCNTCTLIQYQPVATSVSQTELYSKVDSKGYINQVNPQLRLIIQAPFGKTLLNMYGYLCKIQRRNHVLAQITHGRLLDVGCASGEFLKMFDSPKWQLTGVEINRNFAAQAQVLLPNARILTAAFERIQKTISTQDVITLFHVFEHLRFPKQIISKCRQLLKPDGLLIIEVPNGNSLFLKLFGKNWQMIMFPQHYYFWTDLSLKKLLEAQGFSLINTNYVGFISSGPASIANYLRSKGVSSLLATVIGFILLPVTMIAGVIFWKQRDNLVVIAEKKSSPLS